AENTSIGSRSLPIGNRLESYGSRRLMLLTETPSRTRSSLQRRQKKLLRSSCAERRPVSREITPRFEQAIVFRASLCREPAFSARVRNEAADLLRPGENHVGSVSHHTGSHEGRRALLRTVVADIGLEAQIPFPEIAHLPVRGGDLVGIAAMIDRLHPVLRIERL